MPLSKKQLDIHLINTIGVTYKAMLTHSGGVSCINKFTKNNIPGSPTITFIKDSAGYYKCDLSALGYQHLKTVYNITNNIVADNVIIKMRYRSDFVMGIYTYVGGVLTDSVLDKTPISITFYP